MNIYYAILEVFYLIVIAIVTVFCVISFIKSKKITDKIILGLGLILLVFRLLMIR